MEGLHFQVNGMANEVTSLNVFLFVVAVAVAEQATHHVALHDGRATY